jgi:hypothetical protein
MTEASAFGLTTTRRQGHGSFLAASAIAGSGLAQRSRRELSMRSIYDSSRGLTRSCRTLNVRPNSNGTTSRIARSPSLDPICTLDPRRPTGVRLWT